MYKTGALKNGECFHRIAQEIIPDDLFNPDDDWHWFVPSIVNEAFACECYLKSLISDEAKVPFKHDLYTLYGALLPEIKAEITSCPQFRGDDEFLVNLDKNRNVFTQWRYRFEHKKDIQVNVIFLEQFASVLHKIADSKCRENEV